MLLAAYLCGSIPTGVLVGRLAGVDVRAVGSGNIGATNVARTAGRSAGLVTLAIDIAKGAAPVWLAQVIGESPTVAALAGLGAFCGHLWPLFSGFRGGKGVATAAGIFLVLAPLALLLGFVAFATVVGATRIVSLASLIAITVIPVSIAVRGGHAPLLAVAIVITLIVWVAHRENIRRLMVGAEPRFRSRS